MKKKKIKQKVIGWIVLEYNSILNNAKAQFHFSDDLIRQFDNSYKKNFDKNGIYRSLCKDALESAIKEYIKCEKGLILIVDKFNSISLWIF